MNKKFFAVKKTGAALVSSLLLLGSAMAQTMTEHSTNRESVVQPDNIYSNTPFSFSVNGVADGEVVQIQTENGTVVHQAAADKYGRILVPGFLGAGAYAISTSSKGSRPAGHITVKQRPSDLLDRPGDHPAQPLPPQSLHVNNLPQAINQSDSLTLSGRGFSGNYRDMLVKFTSADGRQTRAIVQAASEDQLKLAPLISPEQTNWDGLGVPIPHLADASSIRPGWADLTITNTSTGQTSEPQHVLVCGLQGHLEQHTLVSGAGQTTLLVHTQPQNVNVRVQARVVSGPVDFGDGRREAELATSNGIAIFPVHAEAGAGPFQLAYTLATQPIALWQDKPSNPQEWVTEKAKDCAKGGADTENTNNEKDLKKEAKTDDDYADEKKNWGTDGQPANKKDFKDWLNAEIERLRKILKKEGDGNAKDDIKRAIGDAIEAGKGAGLKYSDGKLK